ncbi:hypothetical protein KY330_01495 [Candidatus Woesearchaeota archaeon]|nr:hypothetical protein [Candidatus Woesearchaeota archaeon]
MGIKDVIGAVILSGAVSLSSATANPNIENHTFYEDLRGIDQVIEEINENNFRIKVKVKGEIIKCGFYHYEWELCKRFDMHEDERNEYLEDILKQVLPVVAEKRYVMSIENLKKWDGIRKVNAEAISFYTVLAAMMTETNGHRRPKSNEGCNGWLQIKDLVSEDTRRYAKRNKDKFDPALRKLAEKVRGLKNKRVRNSISAQIMMWEFHRYIIKKRLRFYWGNRINRDMSLFADAAYNGGIGLFRVLRDIYGKELRWDTVKDKIFSVDNILSKYPNSDVEWATWKKAVACSYVYFCDYFKKRLKQDFSPGDLVRHKMAKKPETFINKNSTYTE